MNKVTSNGMVAVLYSKGFGAGWSTWNDDNWRSKEILCMDAEIVQAVLDGDIPKAVEIARLKVPNFYEGGAKGLEVFWVPEGAVFEIEEYVGRERVHVVNSSKCMVA